MERLNFTLDIFLHLKNFKILQTEWKIWYSTSKHMQPNGHIQILFSLNKPRGQPKASECLSTLCSIARKELHLLSALWKKKEAWKPPDSSSDLSHIVPTTQGYWQDSFWSEAVANGFSWRQSGGPSSLSIVKVLFPPTPCPRIADASQSVSQTNTETGNWNNAQP